MREIGEEKLFLSSTVSLPAVGSVRGGENMGWVLNPTILSLTQPPGAMLGEREGGASQKNPNDSQHARRPARGGSALLSQYH